MFPNDLWIVDPYKGKLMTVVNDVPSEVVQIESPMCLMFPLL